MTARMASDLCGFRGYHKRLRIEFPDGFTVIDGRNGVGKSTIFDAVEFGLTGTITKYGDATADRETIADYIWWTGEGPPPEERYVEVGFHDGNDLLRLPIILARLLSLQILACC